MAFLYAAWPRYYTGFDLATNVAAYLPFGFLCAAAMRRHLATLPAWLLAALLGSALSLVLELLQSYLPNRVPSNLDLACNTAGASAGSVSCVCASAQVTPPVSQTCSTSTWGRMAKTPAMAKARFSPPDKRHGARVARCKAPTCCSAACTRCCTSAGGSLWLRGPKATSSSTEGMKSWSSGS